MPLQNSSPSHKDLINTFKKAVDPQQARNALADVIAARAWTSDGHALFTDWWLAHFRKIHVIKEIAFVAAMQMIDEGRDDDALTIHGVQDHVITNLKIFRRKNPHGSPWSLAYNYPQLPKRAQRKLTIEADDDDTMTDLKMVSVRHNVKHKDVALDVIVATKDAMIAGIAPDVIVRVINSITPSGSGVAAGKP